HTLAKEGRRCAMSVLVTYGSKRGGAMGLAEMVATDLREEGLQVDLLPPNKVKRLDKHEAVVVGGALYASRWHRAAKRFVKRHTGELRERPVFFFSSGPLDDSATREVIPPVEGVQALMERVGARGHITFGGRLSPDAKGFPASAMAKNRAGDWRDPAQVRAWARSIAAIIRTEVPHRS
ncbi:MAG: flavodoxin domain-containing protein, partial [Mycobacteriaceae bacterium]